MESTMKYDIIVIGAGSGGLTAAITAVGFGKKVILIDKSRPGGECTWFGCIPSKALIHKGKEAFVLQQNGNNINSAEVLDFIHKVQDNIYQHETPSVLEKSGIEFMQGAARFIDHHTVQVNDKKIKGKKIIISTGSSPLVPPIKGLKDVPYLTNESIFQLKCFPKTLTVLGGGPIGVELSQAINRLGTKVTIVEMMPHLMFREEQSFVKSIEGVLLDEGVILKTGSKALKAEQVDSKISLTIEKEGKEEVIVADSLLVAIGRVPNTSGLNLEMAGVKYDRGGIKTNAKLQTSQSHIYAIGDVASLYKFSHMANAQGIQAVQNAILPFSRKVKKDNIAWVTFTSPELARAGMTEDEARKQYGDSIRVYNYDFNLLDRAMTTGSSIEKIKVVLDHKGKLLGATILAERAGEMIGELQLLRAKNLNFSTLAGVIHPYPTYSEVFSKIGKQVLIDNLLNSPFVKLFRK